MGIISEIEKKFSDETDSELAANKVYRQAEKELHDYIVSNISDDKQEKIDHLVGNLTSVVAHISIETGMKLGANIILDLLK